MRREVSYYLCICIIIINEKDFFECFGEKIKQLGYKKILPLLNRKITFKNQYKC